MVASYTSRLRLTKQGTNDNPDTWGEVTNVQVIELLEEAISGVTQIDCTGLSDIDISTTTSNGGTDDARHAVLELTGVLGDDINLILPSVEKTYIIRALHTGGYDITVKPAGGASGVVFSTGELSLLYTKGTNIYEVTQGGTLKATNNLSDVADVATSRTNLGLGTISTQDSDSVNITGGTITGVTGVGDVQSVAGKTGVVTLDTNDIGGLGTLATQNTVDATTDIVNLDTQVGFSSFYESAEQTVTYSSNITLTHALGKIPTLATLEFVCTTANAGYSIGDVISFSSASISFTDGFSLFYSTTEVGVAIGNGINVLHKSTAAETLITTSSWRIVLRAWA